MKGKARDTNGSFTSGAPLPEGHTARRLADAMREVPGIPAGMIDRAAAGYYHDYLSPLVFPEITLAGELAELIRTAPREQRQPIRELRSALIAGKFDASREESDAWAASDEGQAAFRELLRREQDPGDRP